jgi:hypothetical protein
VKQNPTVTPPAAAAVRATPVTTPATNTNREPVATVTTSPTKTAKQQGKGKNREAAASTTATTTPKKKRLKQEVLQSLKPGQDSPFRMANGNKSKGCNHTNHYGFVPLNCSYFAKAYVHNKKNYPVKCCGNGCGLNFVNVDDQKEAFNGGYIYACPNAINQSTTVIMNAFMPSVLGVGLRLAKLLLQILHPKEGTERPVVDPNLFDASFVNHFCLLFMCCCGC